MCIFRRKSKKTEKTVAPSLLGKEFRLMRGDFRDYLADQNKTGYYGMCIRDWEMVCPPGVSSTQDQFYRFVCHFMRDLLRASHSVVIVEDVPGSESWLVQKAYFKQLAADHGGVVIEECSKTKSNCAFVFSTMQDSFLNEIFWWMAEHTG